MQQQATPLPQSPHWIAQQGSQFVFLSCPIPELLFEGTRGPGKTDGLLMKFAKYTGRGFGANWRGIIFRETYKQLTDVIAKSKRRFYPAFPGIKFNESKFTWTWPSGEELLLRHMAKPDDYWNYHGHEYPFIGWEELTNWITDECYELMKSCSRSSYEGMPRIYASTCNPFGKGHNWVKGYFIDPAPRGTVIYDERSPQGRVAIHGNIFENKALMRADPHYVSKLEGISDPNRRKAWRFGSWDIAVGTMFDDLWNSDTHVLEPFAIPTSWTIERCLDWGSSKPFSVGWWARSNGDPVQMADNSTRVFPRGTMVRIAEWYGWNGEPNKGLRLTAFAVGQGIRKREEQLGINGHVKAGPADSAIFDIEEGKSIADELNKGLGTIAFIKGHKGPGSRKQGWERIRTMLENAEYNEGEGLYVFSTCGQFIRTVPTLPRDDVDLDDVDTDAEDHVGDETRYCVLRKPLTISQVNMYSNA